MPYRSITQEVNSPSNLVEMDLSTNGLWGVIPSTFGSFFSLGRLHLGNNFIEGQIPDELGSLTGLEDWDLSQCNLSGQIPGFLGNELKLINLNLSFNRFQGEVPTEEVVQNQTTFSMQGNDYLCGGPAFLKFPACPSTTNSKKKHSSNPLKILIVVLGAGGICFALSCIYIFAYRRRYSEVHLRCHHLKLNTTSWHRLHNHLKPTNILLDEKNMTAHVGNFGLAKVVSNIFPAYNGSSSSMAIKGTIGYTPPVNRGIHSTSVKKMGGGHGHDEPYYLHAKHMYNLDRMKNQKLTMTLGVFTAFSIGVGVPIYAVIFQQKKTGAV
ncbi:putative LRR receptor-like serine/threonine-protein kinase [Dorcoceras hygrometricum]|uniref:Putative LRR receptor-like serine/threonine-protein kinase n=1 Tax=Dorcoceras hygrometricum TaxID=472368 RepID=A0A2Z7DHE2_9LAMI|nr:putative LRR receptor-like serine/threonine-protein kinase [Dorcoceras hygrometricum]